LYQEALGFVRAKNYSRGVALFLDLYRYYPEGKYGEEALYRVARAYHDLGRFPEARESLGWFKKQTLIRQGEWREAALLLEGEMWAAEGKWKEALPLFQEATGSSMAEVRQRSHYLVILAADHLGDLSLARNSLTALLQPDAGEPERAYAALKQGSLLIQEGRPTEALPYFKQVLESSSDNSLKAEAAVRAGNLVYEIKNYREAIGYYEVVRKTASPDFWKGLAHVGLIQSYFALPDYRAVVQVFNDVRPAFPDQVRSQMFFLAAEAYRLSELKEGKAQALALYDFILKEFPQDHLAEPSLWARLLLLRGDQKAAKDFLAETVRYLSLYPQSARTYTVQFLRADATYETGEYRIAAPMLEALIKNEAGFKLLKKESQAALLFRRGHTAYVLKEYQTAVDYFERVKAGSATPSMVSLALWLGGQSELSLNHPEAALKSWNTLIATAPDFEQRDRLLWQAGQLAGSQKKYGEMERILRLFVQEFPQDKRQAEAQALLALCRQEQNADRDAVVFWDRARQLDQERYFAEATQQIIRIRLEQGDWKALQTEVEAYDAWRMKHPQIPGLALEVYEWLGQEVMEKDKSEAAEPYLRRVLAVSQNGAQRKRVQLRLALLMSKLQRHGAAVREWQAYRSSFPEEANRSPVLEPLAQAQIGAADFSAAQALAEQILRQNPEGDYNARGRLLLGEVAFGQHNYKEAAKLFGAVALLTQDEYLTPLALTRAEKAYRLAGDDKKADELLLRLKKDYPAFRLLRPVGG
jgi:tetratricopeptide (TPR) repeat protein